MRCSFSLLAAILLAIITAPATGRGQTNQWKRLKTGFGEASALAIDSKGVMYAVTGNELVRSDNAGATWTLIDKGKGEDAPRALALNAHDDLFVVTAASGIRRSTDRGATWKSLSMETEWMLISSLTIDRKGILYAGLPTGGIIIRSTDNGDTWSPILEGAPGASVYATISAIAVDPDGRIFAANYNGQVLASADSGAHWRIAMTAGIDPSYFVLELRSNSKGDLFALVANDGLYRSTDHGVTWNRIADNMGFGAMRLGIMIGVMRDDALLMGTSSAGIYRSTDNGDTWKRAAGYPMVDRWSGAFAMANAGTVYTGFAARGMMRSEDQGLTWSAVPTIDCGDFYALVEKRSNGFLFANNGREILRSTDHGESWQRVLPDTLGNAAWGIFLAPDEALYTTYNGIPQRSTDDGATWQSMPIGGGRRAYQLITAPAGDLYAVSSDSKVFRRAKDEDAWAEVWAGNRLSQYPVGLAGPSGTLFLLSEANFYRSTDRGESWTQQPLPFYGANFRIDSSGVLVAARAGSALFYSTDQGDSWVSLDYDDAEKMPWMTDAERILTDSSAMIVKRDRNGEWKPLAEGMPVYKNNALYPTEAIVIAGDGHVYAATQGGGIFATTMPVSGVREEREALGMAPAIQLAMEPNPVAERASASFNLAGAGHVRIELHDLTGRRLATIADEVMNAGAHRIPIATGGLPAGLYIVELVTEGASIARPVLVTR